MRRLAALVCAVAVCAVAGLTGFASLAQTGTPRSPRVNYMTNCQGCHTPNGDGVAGKVPPMRGVLAGFLTVPGGREFLVRVPGVANSTLGDADLAALMNWLVPTMGPTVPAEFKPFSAAEIGMLRQRRLQDVNSVRAALIAQMPPELRSKAQQPVKP